MSKLKYAWQEHQDKRKEERKQKPKKKFVNKKRMSLKMQVNLRIYNVLRKDYLKDHPVCECGRPGCVGEATQIHHKRGRGRWLNVVEYFLAVCYVCHDWIEHNPDEAKRFGFSISRLGKQ